MNHLQKKVLSVAALLCNISLTTVVAAVATYAWYEGVDNIKTVKYEGAKIEAPTKSSIQWKILKYDDSVKRGVSSHNLSDFYLQPYDQYLTQKNPLTNVILVADVFVPAYSANDQLYVDVSCTEDATHNPVHGLPMPAWTSNICQFKTTVQSYKISDGQSFILNGAISLTDDATEYQTASEFFSRKRLQGTRFVSLHEKTPYKRSNQITLIPEIDASGDTITTMRVYIECSYSPELVNYFITSKGVQGGGTFDLSPDINLFKFRIGNAYKGAYVQIDSQAAIQTDQNYLIAYDGYQNDDMSPVLDGEKTQIATGINYADCYSHIDRIANDENTNKSNYVYSEVQGTLTSQSNAIPAASIQYQTDSEAQAIITDNTSKQLGFNDSTGNTRFDYSNDPLFKKPSLYKLDLNAQSSLILDRIILSGTYPTELEVGSPFSFSGGIITAAYEVGHNENGEPIYIEKNVNVSDCIFSNYDTTHLGTYNVQVTYIDLEGESATANYTLNVVRKIERIEVSDMTTTYSVGDNIVFDGVCKAFYTDGTTSFLPIEALSTSIIAGNDTSTPGEKTVRVTCNSNTSIFADYNVTVFSKAPVAPWALAKSINAGDEIIFVCNTKLAIAGQKGTNDYLSSITTGVTFSGTDKITAVPDTIQIFTVGGSDGNYTFAASSTQYLCKTGSKNTIGYSDTVATWSVTFDAAGNSVVVPNSSSSYSLQFNASSPRFSCYTSTQTEIQIFKKGEDSKGLQYIELSNVENNNQFFIGEAFNKYPSIKAFYQDGSSSVITPDACTFTGYDLSVAGQQEVQVTYTEGNISRSATYIINVKAVVPISLTIETLPTKLVYIQGDNFDFTGGKAVVTYNDGNTKDVTALISHNDPNMNEIGVKKVIMSYTEGNVTLNADPFEITINARELVSITVDATNAKVEYKKGIDTGLDTSGLVITAKYNNNSTQEIDNTLCSYSALDLNQEGLQHITVTYNDGSKEVTDTYDVHVIFPVTGLSIEGANNVRVSESITLTAVVTPTNATNPEVTWESKNPSIATVNASGVVTGVAEGDAQIIIKSKDGSNVVSQPFIVHVSPIKVTQITINGPASVNVGSAGTYTATITPTNATNKGVTWSIVAGNNLATIDATSGVLTANTADLEGAVTIKATANDGSNVSATKDVQIKIYTAPTLVTASGDLAVGDQIYIATGIVDGTDLGVTGVNGNVGAAVSTDMSTWTAWTVKSVDANGYTLADENGNYIQNPTGNEFKISTATNTAAKFIFNTEGKAEANNRILCKNGANVRFYKQNYNPCFYVYKVGGGTGGDPGGGDTPTPGLPTSVGGAFTNKQFPQGETWSGATGSTYWYSGNDGYKWKSGGQTLTSPEFNGGAKVNIQITAGYNGSAGSTITISALDTNKVELSSVVFKPNEVYTAQSTINNLTLTAGTGNSISYIKLVFAKTPSNCGMNYFKAENAVPAQTNSFVNDANSPLLCENLNTKYFNRIHSNRIEPVIDIAKMNNEELLNNKFRKYLFCNLVKPWIYFV